MARHRQPPLADCRHGIDHTHIAMLAMRLAERAMKKSAEALN